MNFRDFVKEDNKRTRLIPTEPEEEYFEEDATEEVEDLDEDTEGDFVEEDEPVEYYEEPAPRPAPRQAPRPVQRVVQRPQPKVQPRPVQRPVQRPQPVYRPQPQRVQRQAMPVDQYNRPIQISKKQLAENTIENTANTLTEAIKRKVDTIFYRFGIQGLEKLDEKILDTIEELQYPEPKPIKKSGVNMRRVPGKRVVRKPKPLPIQDIEPAWKNVPEFKGEMEYPNTEEYIDEQLQPEPIYEETQEPVEEPVEEPIEEQVEEPVKEEPQNELSMMELAEQALNIDPSKVMKHEVGGKNPVFEPQPVPVRTPTEPTELPIALEVPEVASPKILTMPVIEEPKEAPVEEPAPVKKTRKKKVEKDTQTNEEN
jgi:S-DNA-T family DNA segregation ATPase FtsK/SpoIIIE